MFISKIVSIMTDASAEEPSFIPQGAKQGKKNVIGFTLYLSLLSLFFLPAIARSAVNVFPNTPQLQAAFLASTTNQWLGTLSPSLFANSFNLTITSPNPAYLPPVQPPQTSVIFDTTTFATVMKQAVIVSTQNYVNGFANGMMYERWDNAIYFGGFLSLCSSATSFNLIKIDSTTCNGVLGYISTYLVTKTSGIAVFP